jgi:hypothetical protein
MVSCYPYENWVRTGAREQNENAGRQQGQWSGLYERHVRPGIYLGMAGHVHLESCNKAKRKGGLESPKLLFALDVEDCSSPHYRFHLHLVLLPLRFIHTAAQVRHPEFS